MKTPNTCPSCSNPLSITELYCSGCQTTVRGNFELSGAEALGEEEKDFLEIFLAARGSLKEVGAQLEMSYPTARARLGVIIQKLGLGGLAEEIERSRLERGGGAGGGGGVQ